MSLLQCVVVFCTKVQISAVTTSGASNPLLRQRDFLSVFFLAFCDTLVSFSRDAQIIVNELKVR